ncbi:hypothetical protein D9M68_926420 [compost metagenome]
MPPTLPSRSGARSCTATSSQTSRGLFVVLVSRMASVPSTVAYCACFSLTALTLTTSAYSSWFGSMALSAPASIPIDGAGWPFVAVVN